MRANRERVETRVENASSCSGPNGEPFGIIRGQKRPILVDPSSVQGPYCIAGKMDCKSASACGATAR